MTPVAFFGAVEARLAFVEEEGSGEIAGFVQHVVDLNHVHISRNRLEYAELLAVLKSRTFCRRC